MCLYLRPGFECGQLLRQMGSESTPLRLRSLELCGSCAGEGKTSAFLVCPPPLPSFIQAPHRCRSQHPTLDPPTCAVFCVCVAWSVSAVMSAIEAMAARSLQRLLLARFGTRLLCHAKHAALSSITALSVNDRQCDGKSIL